MSIVIIRQDDKIELWKKALNAKNPDIKVYSYLEDHPVDEIEVAMVWKHPKGSLKPYKNLKYIASGGAGVDFIFEDPDLPKDIPITRVVDDMLASDMSEYVTGAVFSYLKNFNIHKINQIKRQWNPSGYHRIADYTVGILGLGTLGQAVAKDLVTFGFQTQGWSNSQKTIPKVKSFVGQQDLGAFLATTEILVCLLPLTPLTKGILNTTLFEKLPQGAYVINVARGGHLVDEDLINMIDKGHISGACLDVFHEEPLPESHPFWQHEKIHITPHCASVSDTESVVPQIIENYKRMKTGQELLHLVSFKSGY